MTARMRSRVPGLQLATLADTVAQLSEEGMHALGSADAEAVRGRQRGQGGERVGHLKGRVGGVRCSQESDSWT